MLFASRRSPLSILLVIYLHLRYLHNSSGMTAAVTDCVNMHLQVHLERHACARARCSSCAATGLGSISRS